MKKIRNSLFFLSLGIAMIPLSASSESPIEFAQRVLNSSSHIQVNPEVKIKTLAMDTTDLDNFSQLLGKNKMPMLARQASFLLYLPSTAPKGIVVMTPGSEGVRDLMLGQHVRHFLSLSLAVAVVDSFAIRNVPEVITNQAAVSLPSQVLDMALAVKTLEQVKEVAGLPLGLFGTSRGGMVVNCVLDKRLLATIGITRSIDWACTLYPAALVYYDPASAQPVTCPFAYVVAQNDDEVSPQQAIDYAYTIKQKNPAFQLTIWPHACHLFDAPFPKTWLPQAESAIKAPALKINSDGLYCIEDRCLTDWKSATDFTNSFITHGISIGYTDESNKKVFPFIEKFFTSSF